MNEVIISIDYFRAMIGRWFSDNLPITVSLTWTLRVGDLPKSTRHL